MDVAMSLQWIEQTRAEFRGLRTQAERALAQVDDAAFFETADQESNSLALIVNLASMLSKRQQNITDIKESLLPILFWCGVICGLIALTNVSTAVLLFVTCMLIMLI